MRIAIVNHKGGVGKSSISVNIAFYYKESKKQLLLVDYDKQHNSIGLFSGYSWQGEEVWRSSDGIISICTKLDATLMKYCSSDMLVDCPPSYESSEMFMNFLQKEGINIDVWLIPVNSRNSMLGADTMTRKIRAFFPNARVIWFQYMCENNIFSKNDREELLRADNVFVYDEPIPYKSGFNAYEQEGGKPLWKFFKGTHFGVKVYDFCKFVYSGCDKSVKGKSGKKEVGLLKSFGKEVGMEVLKIGMAEIHKRFIENNKKKEV